MAINLDKAATKITKALREIIPPIRPDIRTMSVGG